MQTKALTGWLMLLIVMLVLSIGSASSAAVRMDREFQSLRADYPSVETALMVIQRFEWCGCLRRSLYGVGSLPEEAGHPRGSAGWLTNPMLFHYRCRRQLSSSRRTASRHDSGFERAGHLQCIGLCGIYGDLASVFVTLHQSERNLCLRPLRTSPRFNASTT